MRIVIDTNVLISGIFWTGTPCQVLEAWASGAFDLCASAEIMEEYFEVLDRLSAKLGREDLAGRWKTYLFEHIELVGPDCRYTDCRDPDDAKFVECALTADAGFIVSGDDDLLTLGHVGETGIITPAALLKSIKP